MAIYWRKGKSAWQFWRSTHIFSMWKGVFLRAGKIMHHTGPQLYCLSDGKRPWNFRLTLEKPPTSVRHEPATRDTMAKQANHLRHQRQQEGEEVGNEGRAPGVQLLWRRNDWWCSKLSWPFSWHPDSFPTQSWCSLNQPYIDSLQPRAWSPSLIVLLYLLPLLCTVMWNGEI